MAVPVAPTALSAVHGDTTATITYTLAAQTPAVTDIEYALDGGSFVSTGDTTSPVTITGLTNGQQYSITLRAVNSEGNGATSGAVTVTPSTVPDAPATVTLTGGDNTITVAYTAPASNGGNAVASYQYNVNDDGWETAPASPFTLDAANGIAYSVAMRAININGAGAATTSSPATPADADLTNNNGFTDASVYANPGAFVPNLDYNDPDD